MLLRQNMESFSEEMHINCSCFIVFSSSQQLYSKHFEWNNLVNERNGFRFQDVEWEKHYTVW